MNQAMPMGPEAQFNPGNAAAAEAFLVDYLNSEAIPDELHAGRQDAYGMVQGMNWNGGDE